ncbi:MAG: hypothetical protein GDA48_13050 [Hormoscilla sp. GM102CHS1]|nr:hypothetical protein [Hormoscilla sp. GM102CHS1]
MSRPKILQENQSYSFRSYFELPYDTDDILAELGYRFQVQRLSLPRSEIELPRLNDIKQLLEEILPFVSLSSETARRELLVAPLIMEIVRLCHCQLRIEYPVNVSSWLKGDLDYLLRSSRQTVTVIEAKRDDLTRGFTQLAVEMIALAQMEDQEILYGAVTIGEIWRFGFLDSHSQTITQDLSLYNVPDRLSDIMSIILGILTDN